MNRMRRGPGRARGVMLVAAIFVITVMAALVVAISGLLNANSADFSEKIQLMQALNAAESGAGFGMNQLFPPQSYPVNYGTPSCPAETVYEFEAPELRNCSATVQCKLHASVSDTDTDYYSITSTGTCGDVQRTINVHSRFEP